MIKDENDMSMSASIHSLTLCIHLSSARFHSLCFFMLHTFHKCLATDYKILMIENIG